MQPATIRRLLVFSVCLVGVGCLYLVPSMAESFRRAGTSLEQDPSTAATNTAVGLSTTADDSAPGGTGVPTEITSSTRPGSTRPSTIEPSTTQPSTAGTTTAAGETRGDVHRTLTTPAGVTAAVPGRDDEPPAAVGRLTVLDSDPDSVTVSWPAAEDDVVGYRVLLNGFFVQATQQTRATLSWFNDSNTHVVQVRALDAAGNEGPSSPTLLLTRPVPDPELALSPSAPSPTATTKPTVSTSATATEDTDETTDTNDAATPSAGLTEQSGTEEDGS
jgi:hypothetical protein